MKSRFSVDWWLIAPVFVLIIISLTTLFSINFQFFKGQLISLGIALLAFFFFSRIDITFLKQIIKPIYIIALVLLVIGFFIGIESRGSIRWVDILGIRLQFSEILKPFLAVCLSTYLAQFSYVLKKEFLLVFLFLFPILLLIYVQPDLGSALVYLSVVIVVLIMIGFPIRWFVIASLPGLLAIPFIWTRLHDYQQQRVLTFFNPTIDPLGISYNSMQAIITVGSGTFFGKGWFQGTQSALHFLPEKQTDFIFATISEGLGFIGAVFLLLTFVFFCYRIYLIFRNADDSFTRIFAACCFSLFFIQGFVNIGMNVGLLPIVGITLPFVSYGGSSLLSNFIFLGILSQLASKQKNNNILQIR
jgi:rod shape determining protein RodA